jgi:hypothetical protein
MPCSGLLVGPCRQNSTSPSPAEGAPLPSPAPSLFAAHAGRTCRPQFAK